MRHTPVLSVPIAFLLFSLLASSLGNPLAAQVSPSIQVIRNELAASHSLQTREERLNEARRIEGEVRDLLATHPDDPEFLWWAIAAMGLQVDNESSRGKIDRTREIYAETERLRAMAPDHPGGEHAMGRLHAGVMRLNRILRFLAVRLIGGDLLRQASWEASEAHFRRAVALDPEGTHHRFELANLLIDRGQEEEARVLLQGIVERDFRDEDALDALHRTRAQELLTSLEGRR